MPSSISELQTERSKFKPVLPAILQRGPAAVVARAGKATESVADQESVRKHFPNTYGLPLVHFARGKNPGVGQKAVTVGVVLSGGQAPGGHNVLAGLFHGRKKATPRNRLIQLRRSARAVGSG